MQKPTKKQTINSTKKTTEKPTKIIPIENIHDLLNSQIDDYQKVKSGEMGLDKGRALAYMAGKKLRNAVSQIAYNKHLGIRKPIPFFESKKTAQ
jgi:hypothetical protein